MANPIAGKNITLGITGSIAAYKAADLASKLTQLGANITAILTDAALEFISLLTIQSVTGKRAYTEDDLWGSEGHVLHINVGHTSDLIVIAPASANTIAKLANGIADNLLSVTCLAATCPIIIAPAMDSGMYGHPATQENIRILKERGVIFIGPAEGHLASGLTGPGRFEEPENIVREIRYLLSQTGPLAGKKIVVTAGGTREAIDPVRFLANRSSGKQGYALAQAALDYGASVTLVSAPTSISPPAGADLVWIENAAEMNEAVVDQIIDADALIMAAAVADFRPESYEQEKINKEAGFKKITLARTTDILGEVSRIKKSKKLDLKIVGFAAESRDLKTNAQTKLREKNMDMIVANNILDKDAGFGVDTNRVLLMYSDGSTEELPLMKKSEVAEKILQHLVSWLVEGAG
jgi:phosphopantothenoylcysteine decarboxylase/phosphopantothenate--cysteine ligase